MNACEYNLGFGTHDYARVLIKEHRLGGDEVRLVAMRAEKSLAQKVQANPDYDTIARLIRQNFIDNGPEPELLG